MTGTTQPYKAIAALVVSFLAALLAGLQAAPHDLDGMDWLTIILGALVTAGVVFGVPNPPKQP